jgi:diguanylate cyclase (GGDEF)-like protein/PAS domain S-box-containing protein
MNQTTDQIARRSRRWRQASWAVLVCGLLVSLWGWHRTAAQVSADADLRFEQDAATHTRLLQQTLDHYGNLLRTFQAALEANPLMDRNAFLRLYQANNPDGYPGMAAIQYARWVSEAERTQLEQAVRNDRSRSPNGFPEFKVHPPGPRPHYMAVVFAEPLASNPRILGFDQAHDPVRREVMERARDGARLVASAPVELVSGTSRARGFVLRAPVFDIRKPLDTAEQRAAAFLGQVGCAVEASGLGARVMPSTQRDPLRWRLEDLGSDNAHAPTPPALLFDSAGANTPSHGHALADQRTTRFKALGRIYATTLQRAPVQAPWQSLPLATLVAGLMSSLGLWWAVRSVGRQQGEAAALAESLAREATESARQLQSVMNSTQDALLTADVNGQVTSANRAARELLNLGSGDLSLTIRALMPYPGESPHGQIEALLARRGLSPDAPGKRVSLQHLQGETLPAEVTVNALIGHTQAAMLLTLRDMRAQEAAEQAYRTAQRQLDEVDEMRRVIVHHAPYAILVLNRTGVIQAINPAGENLLGYRAAELVGRSTTQRFFDPEQVAARSQKLALRLARPVRDMQVLIHLAEESPDTPSEWALIRADGRRIVAEVTVTVLKNEAQEMTGYLAMAHDVTSRTEAELQLQHQALHDALTGLPNRNMVQEQLRAAVLQCERDGGHLALMFLDIDRFKKINDTLGHQVGDGLIAEVGQRLRNGMRTTDIVARLGGDEFVVLLPRIAQLDDANVVAQKVMDLFHEPMRVGPHELRVTPSVGLVLYPVHGADPGTLMRHADLAMYQAKNLGRNRVQVFNSDLEATTADTLKLENELYKALDRNELRLFYQPQFDCRTGRIIGAEALLRWEHQGKLVPPLDFIPFAEETGLIVPIGAWVLREACRQAQVWRMDTGWPLRMAVNLSAVQLDQPDIAEQVSAALQRSGLDPEALEVEITETVVVRESLRAADVLTQLRSLGVSVAIDDFGVGYSSFGYLRELPVDRFKLDRSFLQAIPHSAGDCRLAAALIAMAHRLEVGIVAEGVETAEQMAFLKTHQCDEAQGYHLGRPMSAEGFAEMLRHHVQASALLTTRD